MRQIQMLKSSQFETLLSSAWLALQEYHALLQNATKNRQDNSSDRF
ncbi:MAG: hypothetical protein PUP93_33740 [Rhizonema sp. NSF051]|nr:hypothetical protein [Rhizonema sp. NSF051]